MTQHPNLRFVVTGTGRCGTQWISGVFNRLGLPCGHEAIFSHTRRENKGLVGDSSWMAAPFLGELDLVVFHQLRHPAKVIRSLTVSALSGLFQPGQPWGQFFLEHCPEAAEYQEGRAPTIAWCAMMWMRWNQMIEPHSDFGYPLEGMGPGVVQYMLSVLGEERSLEEIKEALDRPPVNRHVEADVPELDPCVLEALPFYEELREVAKGYGYEV